MADTTPLPALHRRYLDLMLRLYVDRDPQTSKPQILYTRRWNKVVAEESDLLAAESSKPEVFLAPVCTTGFHNDLIPWLLEDLPSMAGAVDVAGNPGVTAQVIFLVHVHVISHKVGQCWILQRNQYTPDLQSPFSPGRFSPRMCISFLHLSSRQ